MGTFRLCAIGLILGTGIYAHQPYLPEAERSQACDCAQPPRLDGQLVFCQTAQGTTSTEASRKAHAQVRAEMSRALIAMLKAPGRLKGVESLARVIRPWLELTPGLVMATEIMALPQTAVKPRTNRLSIRD